MNVVEILPGLTVPIMYLAFQIEDFIESANNVEIWRNWEPTDDEAVNKLNDEIKRRVEMRHQVVKRKFSIKCRMLIFQILLYFVTLTFLEAIGLFKVLSSWLFIFATSVLDSLIVLGLADSVFLVLFDIDLGASA